MAPTSPLAAIRWLPLANQTAATIPALACVRLVGATLDATGQVIFRVDQPNGDASATYLFNGPCSIAPGAGGSGTLDFPTQATWDSGTPAVGDVWGPKSGQWSLSHGQSPGFAVLGVVDSLTQRMMVGCGAPASATVVKPLYDIAPISGSTPGTGSGEVYAFDGTSLGDSTTSIAVFNLNSQTARAGVLYECIYIDGYAFIVGGTSVTLFEAPLSGSLAATDAAGALTAPATAIWGTPPDLTYPLAAQNDFNLSGATGQKFLVAQSDGGTCYLLQTRPAAASGGITFTLTAGLSGGSAAASVGTAWGSAPDAAGASVTVNDLNAVWTRSLSGAKGEAIYDSVQGYIIVACDQETLKYRGLLGGTLMHSDGSATVGTLLAMNSFPFGQASSDSTISAENVLALGGQSGAACTIEWNQALAQWELTMVAPTPQQVMCRERLGGSNLLQYTTRTMLGWFDDTAESAYGTVSGWTVTNIAATIGIQMSGGDLEYQTQQFSAIGSVGSPSSWEVIFTTVTVTAAVVDLQYDSGYSSTHSFQAKTVNFTAIDPGYPGTVDATASAWTSWASTTTANDLTAVSLSGAGVLTYTTTPNYVMELGTPSLGNAGGSLTTTTATIVAAVAYGTGALSYQTQTLTVLAAGAVSAATNLFTTGSLTAVTNLSSNGTPALTQQTTTFTAINPGSASVSSAWYTPSYQNVVTNVAWDGTNLKQTVTQQYVFGAGTSTTSTIDTPTICATG